MKKLFTSIRLRLVALFALVFCSCNQELFEAPEQGTSEVSIEMLSSGEKNSCRFRFTPTKGVAGYSFALGKDGDRDAFLEGTLTVNYAKIEGDAPIDTVFRNLVPGYYTIYAISTDSTGLRGRLSERRMFLPDGYFTVETYYLSDRSAGFKSDFSSLYYRYEFYLGTSEDRDGFLNDEVEKTYYEDLSMYRVLNYFDLEPDTEYVFYARAFDREDRPTELIEIPFRTFKEGEAPSATLNIKDIDIYKGVYEVVPNSECGRIDLIISTAGMHNQLIEADVHFKGDIPVFVNNWCDVNDPTTVRAVGKTAEIEFLTPSMQNDNALEMYVVTYDKDFVLSGVQNFKFSTPSYDPSANAATATVEISNITSKGAEYTIRKGANMFAAMYNTIEADWFDEFSKTGQYHEYYMHELMFMQGMYFFYGKTGDTVGFTETAGLPNTRYYAGVCPMNSNGPKRENGWGALVLEEYRTLNE